MGREQSLKNLTTDEAKAHRFGGIKGNPRNPGGWKKADSARYKLEQMMKLTEAELKAVAEDKDAPYFERKLATCIKKGQWKEIEGMINQVYGQPKLDINSTIRQERENPLNGLTIDELRTLKALKKE